MTILSGRISAYERAENAEIDAITAFEAPMTTKAPTTNRKRRIYIGAKKTPLKSLKTQNSPQSLPS